MVTCPPIIHKRLHFGELERKRTGSLEYLANALLESCLPVGCRRAPGFYTQAVLSK